MSEAKFTKGEWKVHSIGSQFAVGPLSNADDQSNGMMNVATWIEKFDYFTEEQSLANAHLIAAAPEMYSELEELSGIIRRMGVESASDRIDHLLAKARGEK